jgi:hypothetical protein
MMFVDHVYRRAMAVRQKGWTPFMHDLESWAEPPIDPRRLSMLYKRLLALYELRLDAHYRAQQVPRQQAQYGLDTVVEVMRLIQQHTSKQPQRES